MSERKDDPEEFGKRVHECILKVNQRFSSVNHKVHTNFSVKVNEKVFIVDYDDILFFETWVKPDRDKNKYVSARAKISEPANGNFSLVHQLCIFMYVFVIFLLCM
jgi:hypothetical protein